MKASNSKPTVWGVFVGDGGDQLEVFNSKSGPFPPKENSDGLIAIGWPAVGDLRMFQGNYADYVHKFRVPYGQEDGHQIDERTFKTKANMPWYFAFEMREGDWVICPCSAHGLLLVGEIIGDYEADYHDNHGLNVNGQKRPDFVHLRAVRWMHVIPNTDRRYGDLNRIGQLTVSRPNISLDQLQEVINRKQQAA